MQIVKAGAVDVTVTIRIVDALDGTPETGVVAATSGLDLWYRNGATGASTDISEADLSALTDAHSDGGLKHINDGYYRLDLPDAAVPAAGAVTVIAGAVTGMIVLGTAIQASPQVDAVAISGDTTAADNLETMLDGTGGATLSLAQLNVVNNSGSAIVASSTGGNGHGIAASGNGTGEGLSATGGATGHGAEFVGGATSGDGLKLAPATDGYGLNAVAAGSGKYGIRCSGGASGAGLAAVGGADGAGILVAGNGIGDGITSSGGATNRHGLSLSGNGSGAGLRVSGGATGHGIQAAGGATSGNGIYAAGTAGNSAAVNLVGQGSAAGLLSTGGATGHGAAFVGGATSGDGINTTGGGAGDGIDAVGTGGGVDLRADITGDITGTASGNATAAALATVDDFLDTEIAAIKAVTDALTAAAAAKLATSAGVMVTGTVDTTGFTATTTILEADDITEATADHFNGRVIIFTSGALLYQATTISDYALSGGRGRFTYVATTEAPANNDTFIII